jgi:GT2 family glycosyltransferase
MKKNNFISILNFNTHKITANLISQLIERISSNYVINILDNSSQSDGLIKAINALTIISENDSQRSLVFSDQDVVWQASFNFNYYSVNICIYHVGKNLGFGAGHNFLLGKCIQSMNKSDGFFMLNNDIELNSDLIGGLALSLDMCNESILSPVILNSDGSVWFNGAVYSKVRGCAYHDTSHAPDQGTREIESLCGCVLAMSGELARKLNPIFDERFFVYGEDTDLSKKAKLLGIKLTTVQSIYVKHFVSASSNNRQAINFYMNASRILLIRKWERNPLYIFLFIIYFIMSRAALCMLHRDISFFFGIRTALIYKKFGEFKKK